MKKLYVWPCIAALMLSACTEEAIDYPTDQMETSTLATQTTAIETTTENETTSSEDDSLIGVEWKEGFKITNKFGDDIRVLIDLKTESDLENTEMSVVKCKIRNPYSASDKERILKQLADGGAVYNNEEDKRPKYIYERQLELAESQLNDTAFVEMKDYLEDHIELLTNLLNEAPNEFEKVEEYDNITNFMIYIKDIPYKVMFGNTIYFIEVYSDILDEEQRELIDVKDKSSIISKEDAKASAEKLLDELEIMNRYDGTMNLSAFSTGMGLYDFMYSQGKPIENTSAFGTSGSCFYEINKHNVEIFREINYPHGIVVSITQSGCLNGVTVCNELIPESEEVDVPLLKLSNIKDIIKDEINSNEQYHFATVDYIVYKHLKLCYVGICDEATTTYYELPCWKLSRNDYYVFDETDVYINAIDGSILNVNGIVSVNVTE